MTVYRRIDHVGIAVADLDTAIEQYRDWFGAQLVHREVNEEQGVDEAMLVIGEDNPAAPRIQLLAPLRPDSPIGAFLQRHGPGLNQIAYTVTDVEQAAAELRGKGMRVMYDAPRRGTAGSRINFVHPKDAGGVLVELVEPAPDGAPTH